MMPRRGVKLSPEAEEKQRAAIRAWRAANVENLTVGLKKGKRDAYKRLASARGTSVSAMIQDYMDEQYRITFQEEPGAGSE